MFVCFVLTFFVINAVAYKIPQGIPQGIPLPVLRNAPFVYRGPVFIVQEIEDITKSFRAQIVEGGIEMVLPVTKSPSKLPFNALPLNESLPEIQEDPEYFAVLVTPETVTQAQISRTTIISLPLEMLLLGIASRIPWIMVLKRQNHFDYFRNLTPVQIPGSQRRRSKSLDEPVARLFTESRKYDLVYTENDKHVYQNICINIIEELTYLDSILHQYDEKETYNSDEINSSSDKNETKNEPIMNNENDYNTKSMGESTFEKPFFKITSLNSLNKIQTFNQSESTN